MAAKPTVIDGAMLEGGGQILRNAASLSCLLQKPVTVNNIRAGRSNPGLRPQHLTGLKLISDICGGALQGGHVGSEEITFLPQAIRGGNYMADTKTAGSICLLIQAALPCQLFGSGPGRLSLRGGTNAEMAPQIDYLTWVFAPMAERFGVQFECDIQKRGYFPKGGGQVRLSCKPVQHLKPVVLKDRGNIARISGRAFVAGVLPMKVAHTMSTSARHAIQSELGDIPVNIEQVKEPDHMAVGTGTGIIIVAETDTGCLLAGSALGKRGKPAEEVGQEAAEMLLGNLRNGGCVDDYLQDQLIILMTLAKGKSQVICGPLTLHTETAIAVAQRLTPVKFNILKLSEEQTLIECEGIGLVNSQVQ